MWGGIPLSQQRTVSHPKRDVNQGAATADPEVAATSSGTRQFKVLKPGMAPTSVPAQASHGSAGVDNGLRNYLHHHRETPRPPRQQIPSSPEDLQGNRLESNSTQTAKPTNPVDSINGLVGFRGLDQD